MRILLVAYYFDREDSIGGERARAIARHFPSHGIQVVPLFLAPQDQWTAERIGVSGTSHFYTPRWRYLLIRCWQAFCQRLGVYQPILGDWRDRAVKAGLEALAVQRFDAILASYPPIEAFEIGLTLSRASGLPLFADFRDGLIFEPLEQQRLKVASVRRHYECVEQQVLVSAHLVTTVSDPLSDHFKLRFPHMPVVTLPNGFDVSEVSAQQGQAKFFAEGQYHLVHTGRLAASRQGGSLSALLLALRSSASEKICLHLVGALTRHEIADCQPWIERGQVVFWGVVPHDQALAMQAQADALLVLVPPEQKSVATGKIFEYLAAKKPILALADGSEAGRIVARTQSGIVVSMRDQAAIEAALKRLLACPRREWAAMRDEDAIAAYSRAAQMERFAALLQHYVSHQDSRS